MTMQPAVPEPIVERLVRIETKLDGWHGGHVDHETRLRQLELDNIARSDHEPRLRALEQDNTPGGHADHESRIRRLERSWWMLAGAAAAGGGVVGSLIAPLIGGN